MFLLIVCCVFLEQPHSPGIPPMLREYPAFPPGAESPFGATVVSDSCRQFPVREKSSWGIFMTVTDRVARFANRLPSAKRRLPLQKLMRPGGPG